MAGNPWQVESILAFYCLKCPECDFNSKEENNFVHHAKEYHPLSCVLFGQETTNGAPYNNFKEEISTAHIKQEQNSDLSYEDYYNYDGQPTTENLPLSFSYPDISMNEEQGNLLRGIVNFFSNNFSLFQPEKKVFTRYDFHSENDFFFKLYIKCNFEPFCLLIKFDLLRRECM